MVGGRRGNQLVWIRDQRGWQDPHRHLHTQKEVLAGHGLRTAVALTEEKLLAFGTSVKKPGDQSPYPHPALPESQAAIEGHAAGGQPRYFRLPFQAILR